MGPQKDPPPLKVAARRRGDKTIDEPACDTKRGAKCRKLKSHWPVLGKAARREAVLLNGPDLQHAYQEAHCRLTRMMLRSVGDIKRRRLGIAPGLSA